jgi:hypothetical protein
MTGPLLKLVEDRKWQTHLSGQDVSAWYHQIPETAPGAYSRPDQDGVPDSDDVIVTTSGVWAAARHYFEEVRTGGEGLEGRAEALLLSHEYDHCVGHDDHPETPGAAILHAIFVARFGIGAFTRLLRWRETPAWLWADFQIWLEQTTPQRFL